MSKKVVTKIDRQNGEILEEFHTATCHIFEDGIFRYHFNDTDGGVYTGRFRWVDQKGNQTRWYTTETAPKWLLKYYELLDDGYGSWKM